MAVAAGYVLGAGPNSARGYDVSADGTRFLMIKDELDADIRKQPPAVVVVLNWFEDLKRRVP